MREPLGDGGVAFTVAVKGRDRPVDVGAAPIAEYGRVATATTEP